MTTNYETYAASAWTPSAPKGTHATGETPIVITTYVGKHRNESNGDTENV
jgi:hypothetical protein